MKVIDEVKGFVKLIDELFFLGENFFVKLFLWKYVGYLSFFYFREVYDLEVKVLKICEDLW